MDRRYIDNPDDKKYQIEKVRDHHREIMRMLIATNGKCTNEKIGEAVGVTAQTVSNVRNNPIVQEAMHSLQIKADDNAIDVNKKVREMFPLAAKVINNAMRLAEDSDNVEMMEPKVLSQSIRAAVAVMDHAHPKQVKGTILHGHVTMDQINALKEKARAKIEGSKEMVYEEIPVAS